VYRLVLERYATWAELERMSIDDVDLICVAADEWEDAVRRADQRGKRR